MAFFGFDSTLPRDRPHNQTAPGFSQPADPFAGLGSPDGGDDDALDFEDTYDGLGDQLDEADDALNDDTFGGVDPAVKPVGKDFDFFGQTAKVSNAISEEQVRFTRQQPPSISVTNAPSFVSPAYTRPARSGYERYKNPGYLPDLQADAALWGDALKKPAHNAEAPNPPAAPQTSTGASTGGKKMMSLEEVEAAMLAQAKKPAVPLPAASQPIQAQEKPPEPMRTQYPHLTQPTSFQTQQQYLQQHYMMGLQQPAPPEQEFVKHTTPAPQQSQQPGLQILQRSRATPTQPSVGAGPAQVQPIQILQNPNRLSGDHQRHAQQSLPMHPMPVPGLGPRQLGQHRFANLTEDERTAFLLEEAKRAKRNHKIFLLSKDNGLMTPQDKNFITRIQLQQLVTATGNPNEHGVDPALSEDFYYQVHNQIRGGPRQHPSQPLSNFAQTYLFQTGGRHGNTRRQARVGDNHMQRMEQQVQRAVEAAKNKPKNKQLVIEGSLGKISFSNAKTPKPLLNIKRAEAAADGTRSSSARATSERKTQQSSVSGSDRKTVLRDIENVYDTLMKMEDHGRQNPTTVSADQINPAAHRLQIEWDAKWETLNKQLWKELKVHEPIGATVVHPFIAFLSLSKGKRTIPRVFRQITTQQQTTILTMIVVHLDQLDVVRQAQLVSGEPQLNAVIRENVELFSMAVMPSLFGYLSEAGLEIVEPILGLILSQTNIDVDARTRIGVSMLTMILSRAELIKQAGKVSEQEWELWISTYNKFFDALEPTLPHIFPGTVNTGEDVYVWHFLAAIGVGASPDQQQRLVMAVKDRVMETVTLAKTLPPEMSGQRLANVNIFMRSIGLDVELLA